jgi:predicted transcriptional regulator
MNQPTLRPATEEQDDDAFRAAVAEGLADDAAGRTLPYEDVRRWLLSWGSDEELPPPQCG